LALVIFPILALVTATAEALVILTFSTPYRPAAPILTVLIFTYSAYTLYITLVTSFLAENRPRRALAIPVVLLPMALVVLWLGIDRFGTLGAAFASLLTVTIAASVVTAYVLRRFKPAVSGLLPSLLRIGLASVVIWALAWFWSPSGLLLPLAYGLLGALYLAILLILRELRLDDLKVAIDWLPIRKPDTGG
jgi:O-antigen/teichoic acid export membrane protein